LAIPNYIIPIKKGEKKEKKTNLILYDPAVNIHIISYLLTNKKRKEREKSFLFCLYDSAINIHVFMLGN
jgi:hypothetical protein